MKIWQFDWYKQATRISNFRFAPLANFQNQWRSRTLNCQFWLPISNAQPKIQIKNELYHTVGANYEGHKAWLQSDWNQDRGRETSHFQLWPELTTFSLLNLARMQKIAKIQFLLKSTSQSHLYKNQNKPNQPYTNPYKSPKNPLNKNWNQQVSGILKFSLLLR